MRGVPCAPAGSRECVHILCSHRAQHPKQTDLIQSSCQLVLAVIIAVVSLFVSVACCFIEMERLFIFLLGAPGLS